MTIPDHLRDTPDEILNHGLVQHLLVTIEGQWSEIEKLKKEIRILKGHSAKPSIPPNSNLEGKKSDLLSKGKKNSFTKKGQEAKVDHSCY